MLSSATIFSCYRNRDKHLRIYFSVVYCNDIKGLITTMGISYNTFDRRLFIDSSTKNLKAVLLNNEIELGSIPTEIYQKKSFINP